MLVPATRKHRKTTDTRDTAPELRSAKPRKRQQDRRHRSVKRRLETGKPVNQPDVSTNIDRFLPPKAKRSRSYSGGYRSAIVHPHWSVDADEPDHRRNHAQDRDLPGEVYSVHRGGQLADPNLAQREPVQHVRAQQVGAREPAHPDHRRVHERVRHDHALALITRCAHRGETHPTGCVHRELTATVLMSQVEQGGMIMTTTVRK